MRIDIDGPYKRERRRIVQEFRAYITIAKIIIVAAVLLIGIHTVNQLDDIMAAQRIQDKTMADAMDQLMAIRQDLDRMEWLMDDPLPWPPEMPPAVDEDGDLVGAENVDSVKFYLTSEERETL